MIHIRFIAADQAVQDIEARPGQSLMDAAVAASVKGIEADCGGTLTCATCHVHVPTPWGTRLAAPSDDEQVMLEFTASVRGPDSRLSCQIQITPELDGMVVLLPATQH